MGRVSLIGDAVIANAAKTPLRFLSSQPNDQNHPVAAKRLCFEETPDRQLGCIFLFALSRLGVAANLAKGSSCLVEH
jgi:hypothetical protein